MKQDRGNKQIAVRLTGVKKQYRIGQIGGGTLTADLQSWWARKRGKQDPNLRIDQDQRLIGQTFMALNGIDLDIYKGEALGIIGSNGAGKSTMLKLLSRVTAPTEGSIDIHGRIASMLEVGTGFHGEMTGRENVYLNGAILGMTKSEIDSKMDDIVEFSEVREFIDTPVKRYSSGMYVKLAFSVAAHLDSEIMIMDEVLAVGDMAFQKKCLDKMREVADKEGRTILYVSHNMNTIRRLCDRCIVLNKGRVIFDGDVDQAIQIYLTTSDVPHTSKIDYRNIPRLAWLKNVTTKVRFIEARYVDKQDIVFFDEEKLKILLLWKCEQDVQNVSLRVEILKEDRTPIGTAFLFDFYTGKKGQIGRVECGINISALSNGKYAMNYVLFERDNYGNNVDIDCVHGLFFEKKCQNTDIEWVERSWGAFRFSDIEKLS